MKNFVILTLLFVPFLLFAGDKFQWRPVNQSDWEVQLSDEQAHKGAVMLFEIAEVDDRDLANEKCYYTLYRRIRILNYQGRQWGDVQVPIFYKNQKVEAIKGRTILRDGTIVELDENHIHEKEVLRTEDAKIKQKSFYLPGISNDCIIEYYIRLRLERPVSYWLIEKDLNLKQGELTWKFFRGEGLSRETLRRIADRIVPNFIILNKVLPVGMEQKPNLKNPKEIVFTVQDVPAFQSEPLSLPDMAIKMNIRLYYGNQGSAEAYWGDQSRETMEELQKFWEDDDRLEDVLKEFKDLPSKQEKMQAAYQWIQKNLKNTLYEYDDDFDENETVNDVLEHGYGSSSDLNKVYVDMLRSMNIDAMLAYVVDRDEGLFIPKVKYWQFNRSLVFVELGGEMHGFYNPAQKFLPFGRLPWYNEGVLAFVVGSMNHLFVVTKSSPANKNQVIKYFSWEMDSALSVNGSAKITYNGHAARRLRFQLEDVTPEEEYHFLKKEARQNLSYCEADSFKINNPQELTKPVVLRFKVHLSQIGNRDGQFLFVRPLQFVRSNTPKIYDENRNFSIVLDYAKKLIDIVSLTIPEGVELVSLPPTGMFRNETGNITVTYRWMEPQRKLVIQRMFVLKNAFIHIKDFKKFKELLNKTAHISNAPIILKVSSNNAQPVKET